ncbi:hypothetical protein I79_019457 [Cricetulus griseus]|uniref:Uncharacterized protein n=1 Tax=Cricetulus griseus TaxID=10029 RepID=G3I7G9_CRIGR|nr:hypothetical protein I79_019457 [Cricetulus griseus]
MTSHLPLSLRHCTHLPLGFLALWYLMGKANFWACSGCQRQTSRRCGSGVTSRPGSPSYPGSHYFHSGSPALLLGKWLSS